MRATVNRKTIAAETDVQEAEDRSDDPIGGEIRRIRKTRGLSLEDVAKLAGVSIGLVSQIERGIVSPSIRSLRQLSKALGVPVSWFFQTEDGAVDDDGDRVVRAAHRRRLSFRKNGVIKELLTPHALRNLQMLLITLEPDAAIDNGVIQGSGEKCGIVLTGALDLVIEDRTHTIWEGDSFGFDSSLPHSIHNRGQGVTRVLWIATPPVY
jgi:transcriptional regulator with XRE-family HTH domain